MHYFGVFVFKFLVHWFQRKSQIMPIWQTYANRLLYSRMILFATISITPITRECTIRPLYEIRELRCTMLRPRFETHILIINILRIREGTGNAE